MYEDVLRYTAVFPCVNKYMNDETFHYNMVQTFM